MWALLIVAILVMVAIVVDLGNARATRRDNQSAADLAGLAAGFNLGNSRPRLACVDAWSYLQANAEDFPTNATSPCSNVPTSCPNPVPALASRTHTAVAGEYTINIVYPVTDADIADPKFGGVGANDGQTCQRMKVEVVRTVPQLFSRVIGYKTLNPAASAVVRSGKAVPIDKPSLWLLEPKDCPSLSTGGTAAIQVGTATNPGLISVDSNGAGAGCSGTSPTIAAGGSTAIRAIPTSGTPMGAISLFGLGTGNSCNDAPNACNQGDVSSGRISPQPIGRPTRATRAPVDHQFNCKSDLDGNENTSIYPPYRTTPERVEIPDCPDAPGRPAYIDQLKAAVGVTPGVMPGGGGTWNVWAPARSCNAPNFTSLSGNWWINCPNFNVPNATTVSLNGNVVFDGNVSVGNGGNLQVNTNNPIASMSTLGAACAPVDPEVTPPTLCPSFSSQKAAYVFMRGGVLDVRERMTLHKTALYQHTGHINIIAGATPIWTSPDEGAFRGLSLWSETSSTNYQILGGGSMNLEGTFFTPEAKPMRLTGGGAQNALQAQFISNALLVQGNAVLALEPLTTKGVSQNSPVGALIR